MEILQLELSIMITNEQTFAFTLPVFVVWSEHLDQTNKSENVYLV